MTIAHTVVCGQSRRDDRAGNDLSVGYPRALHDLAKADDGHLRRVDDWV